MTTRTAEITAAVKTAQAEAGEAVTRAEQLLETVREKTETAAMHGWHGVATTMEAADEHLEGVVEHLGTAAQSGEAAATPLDEITDQMSSPEVASRLVTALGELQAGRGELEAAAAGVEEASEACQQAGQESLPVALQSLREQVDQVQEQYDQLATQIDEERSQAETWSEDEASDDQGGGSAGN